MSIKGIGSARYQLAPASAIEQVHGALPLTKPVLEKVIVEKKKAEVSGSNDSSSNFWKDMAFTILLKDYRTGNSYLSHKVIASTTASVPPC